MPVIETPRLSLREITAEDDGFVFRLMNEPAYHEFIGDRGIRTPADARAYILQKLVPSYARLGYGLYLVELRERRVPVGICGLVKRDALEHPDIGFAFLREHWSRGLALEAAGAALARGLGPLGLGTILGITMPANQASIRLLEKLGLRYQRMVRVPPNECDSMLFSTEAGKGGRGDAPLAQALVGTWELLSREDRTPGGEPRLEPSLGRDPVALLYFDAAGHFAAQFMKRDRGAAPEPEAGGPAANNSRARGGYDAYFGTYLVDEASGVVTTTLLAALSPENVGQVFARTMGVVGDRLTIRLETSTAQGEKVVRTLLWKRVG
jgi:[ribosomal protein S5]-alanine N-acetyltransferase